MVTFLFIAAIRPGGLMVTGPPAIELDADTPASIQLTLRDARRSVADVPVLLRSQDPAYVVPPAEADDLPAWFAAHTTPQMSFIPEQLHASTDDRGVVRAVIVASGDARGPLSLSASIDGLDLVIPVHLRDT